MKSCDFCAFYSRKFECKLHNILAMRRFYDQRKIPTFWVLNKNNTRFECDHQSRHDCIMHSKRLWFWLKASSYVTNSVGLLWSQMWMGTTFICTIGS